MSPKWSAGAAGEIMSTEAKTKWIRPSTVLKMTGWDRKYLDKLRERGVLRVWKPFAHAWCWYDQDQIESVLNGSKTK